MGNEGGRPGRARSEMYFPLLLSLVAEGTGKKAILFYFLCQFLSFLCPAVNGAREIGVPC